MVNVAGECGSDGVDFRDWDQAPELFLWALQMFLCNTDVYQSFILYSANYGIR